MKLGMFCGTFSTRITTTETACSCVAIGTFSTGFHGNIGMICSRPIFLCTTKSYVTSLSMTRSSRVDGPLHSHTTLLGINFQDHNLIKVGNG